MLGFNGGLLGIKRDQKRTTPGLWFPSERAIIESTDRYWDNVSLLLHMDGTNGSTTFTDASSNAFTVTAYNSAEVSTAESKYGGASLYVPGGSITGTPHRLEVASNAAFQFGSGDFTIELWMNAASQDLGSLCAHTSLSGNQGWCLGVYDNVSPTNATRKLTLLLNGASFALTSTVDAFSDNTWTYVAVTKQGTGSNNINMYSGTSGATTNIATGTYATALASATTPLMIGSLVNGVNWNTNYPLTSYVDELRITKGIARDVSSVPTNPFPNE